MVSFYVLGIFVHNMLLIVKEVLRILVNMWNAFTEKKKELGKCI